MLTVRWKLVVAPALHRRGRPGLAQRQVSGRRDRRERHRGAVVREVVGVPEEIREGNDRARYCVVGHRGADAVGRQRGLVRDHAVLAGAELGDVADDEWKSEPGGAPMLSPVGSNRQTPVPPEIEIAVGGFSNCRRQEVGR